MSKEEFVESRALLIIKKKKKKKPPKITAWNINKHSKKQQDTRQFLIWEKKGTNRMSRKQRLIKFNNKYFKTKQNQKKSNNEAKCLIFHLMGSSTLDILEEML